MVAALPAALRALGKRVVAAAGEVQLPGGQLEVQLPQACCRCHGSPPPVATALAPAQGQGGLQGWLFPWLQAVPTLEVPCWQQLLLHAPLLDMPRLSALWGLQ